MKICIVMPHFLPHVGGGELLWFDIAKGLQNEGHEVRVITSGSAGIKGNVPYQGGECILLSMANVLWTPHC